MNENTDESDRNFEESCHFGSSRLSHSPFVLGLQLGLLNRIALPIASCGVVIVPVAEDEI